MKATYNKIQCRVILRDRLGTNWREYIIQETQKRRKERKLTKRALALKLGITAGAVRDIERRGMCYPKALIAILKELQIECIEAP